MKKNDIIDMYLLLCAIVLFALGVIAGAFGKSSDIEKNCIYEGRIEFSGQMFSCQWLPGVTTADKQYSAKPHPSAKVIK